MKAGQLAEDLMDDIAALEENMSEDDFHLNTKLIIAGYLMRAYDLGRIAMAGRVGDDD